MPQRELTEAPKALKYARQYIVKLDGDADTAENVRLLQDKRVYAGDQAKSAVRDGTKEADWVFGELPENSRLYLVGHGTANSSTVGGWTDRALGERILRSLGDRKIRRLSLYACLGGGNLFGETELPGGGIQVHGPRSSHVVQPAESFAGRLTRIVGAQVGTITARTTRVKRSWHAQRGVDTKDVYTAYNGLFDALEAQQRQAMVALPSQLWDVVLRIPDLQVAAPRLPVARQTITKEWIPTLDRLNGQNAQELGRMRVQNTHSLAVVTPGTYDTLSSLKSGPDGWHHQGTKLEFWLDGGSVRHKWTSYRLEAD